MLGIARRTAGLIGLEEGDVDMGEWDFVVDERWHAGRYGAVDRETEGG